MEDPGLDVFGQPPVIKKFQDCICPSCNRGLAASRFAPHLEKCMGMGRNSSRIASRRIANNSKETRLVGFKSNYIIVLFVFPFFFPFICLGYIELVSNLNLICMPSAYSQTNYLSIFWIFSSSVVSEDEDDEWTISGDRRRKRRERSNGNAKKPSKNLKADRRNGDSNSSFGGSISESLGSSSGNNTSFDATSASLDSMRPDERRSLLSTICGVVSEHTKKLCTRSLRCPQHSDEQRRALRALVLIDDTGFQSEIQVCIKV